MYYSVLVVFLFLAATSVVYGYVTNILTRRAEKTLTQTVQTLGNNLDSQLNEMNEISIRVAYSNLIKARFESYRTDSEPVANYYDQQALRDIFIAIMGPIRSVLQLNLFDFEGTVVGAGHRNFASLARIQDRGWFAEAMALEGSKYITAPHFDEETGKVVVGLCRVYYDNTNSPVGIIETLQEYSVLVAPFSDFRDSPPSGYEGSRVYVLDARHRLLFPAADDLSEYDATFIDTVLEFVDTTPPENPYRYQGEVAAYSTSSYSGFTVILSQPTSYFRLPIRSFSRLMALLLAASLTLALATSFFLSRRLTLPIKKIHSEVRDLDIGSVQGMSRESLDSGFNELEDLYGSFKQMVARLGRSTADLIDAKAQEMNARLLALQSQMNPHFLYNTLSTVSILAEEDETADIVRICDHLSSMLRYIASDAADLVPMSQEIDHTIRYLELMKFRYEDDLEYDVQMSDNMRETPVPKLIVQPLVENAIKYGIHTKPPWRIQIRGTIENGAWAVQVTDSGSGFDDQKLAELHARMGNALRDGMIGNLRVGGMGLLNIFARLQVLYADQAVFVLGNGSAGGASILIGGAVRAEGGRA